MRINSSHPLAALAKPARIEPEPQAVRAKRVGNIDAILEDERRMASDMAGGLASPKALRIDLGIWLPYPPSGNRYWRHVGTRVVVSKEAREYRKRVAQLLAGAQPLDGDVGVDVLVHRPARRGDLDNTLKVLLDAVRGFAYRDDSQVVSIHAQRFDGVGEPGVRFAVKPAVGFSP